MSDNFNEINEDDDTPMKRVGRLSDMDTKEVSLVDMAANQRRFLTVKRHQENNMDAATATDISTETDPTIIVVKEEATQTTQVEVAPEREVAKGMAVAVLEQAHERVDYLHSAIDAAEVAKSDEPTPDEFGREARAVQFMLKGLSGVTCKSTGLMIPVDTNLDECGPVTKAYKDEALKVLHEVSRRLTTLKADLTGVEVLDHVQARSINATADLLAQLPESTMTGKSVILLSSLNDEQREVVLAAVEKSVAGLVDVYVALQTDSVQKGSDIADQFEVGSILHDHAAILERTVMQFLSKSTGEVDLIDAAVEEMRTLQPLTKAYTIKPMFGKFSVMDGKKMVKTFPNQAAAEAYIASMKDKKSKAKTSKMEALMKVMINEPEVQAETQETETEKVGRPMRGDRLNRLRSATALLKDALGDLRSGSVSMEKFKKLGAVLSGLINELQVEKRGAIAALSGVEDKRTASPEAPNMGSGVQPDLSVIGTMDDVMGEGTGGTAGLLKNAEGLTVEQLVAKRVDEIAKSKYADENIRLKGELASLKKARSAPSTPPSDGEVELAKGGDDEGTGNDYWPSDMASWDGKETRDEDAN